MAIDWTVWARDYVTAGARHTGFNEADHPRAKDGTFTHVRGAGIAHLLDKVEDWQREDLDSDLDTIADITDGSRYFRDDDDELTEDIQNQLVGADLPDDDDFVDAVKAKINATKRPIPAWPGPHLDQPSSEEFNSVAGPWRYSDFYSHVDTWRHEARQIQRDGWNADDWDEYADPPSVGPLVAAIAHHPATDAPIYRGMQVSQDYADRMEPGSAFTMGLSSFTGRENVARNFARDPSATAVGFKPKTGGDVPVVLHVEPGARSVPLEDGADEHVTMGQFEVVDRTVRDGVTFVTVKQTSPLEAQ